MYVNVTTTVAQESQVLNEPPVAWLRSVKDSISVFYLVMMIMRTQLSR